jgi:signal transduction histidine kinase/ActR/RegA family two-component response regulator
MTLRILTVAIKAEHDVVAARQRARQIAAICGFKTQDQVRIATSVSELARNVYGYAGSGKVEFAIEGETSPQVFTIRIEDEGPGIAALDLILSGNYSSSTGMGVGMLGAKRLMDQFDVVTAPGAGTRITLKKLLPAGAAVLTAKSLGSVDSQLTALPADVTLSEIQHQNQELLATLAELKARQEELLHLTRELEDTNRGVVALYAELDEKAGHLRRADQMKSRFLSNTSHEFRTPLNSIRALSRLLLDRADGDLSPEQEKQVSFILQAADSLSELVNDLLDLAKIEAGKIDVRPTEFQVADLFSALRGMLKPLLVTDSVKLTFDVAPDVGKMYSDEAKVSQILRNFISNALKFTDSGEVEVRAVLEGAGIRFTVQDTGIGIKPEDQDLIFEEFSQIENRLQHKVKGTGLGLPLCRKLAQLLGGTVGVNSVVGKGSVFHALIPLVSPDSQGEAPAEQKTGDSIDGRLPVLVVEDRQETRLLYERFLQDTEFCAIPARSLREAEEQWQRTPPKAVVLDIMLSGEDAWRWLTDLKNSDRRRHVPVVVATEVEDKRKGLALGADAYFIKPLFKDELVGMLRELVAQAPPASAPPDQGRV